MGIVVTLAMLLAIYQLHNNGRFSVGILGTHWAVLVLGLWNVLWYGAQNLLLFWGQAAIVSGCLMIFAALIVSNDKGTPQYLANLGERVSGFRWLVSIGLGLSFALYAITITRLNLGLPIIS